MACLVEQLDALPKRDPRRLTLLRRMEELSMPKPPRHESVRPSAMGVVIIDIPTAWPGFAVRPIPTDASVEFVLCLRTLMRDQTAEIGRAPDQRVAADAATGP